MKKKQFIYGILSFVIPVAVMMFLYWRWKIYPGSTRTLISGDGITQFANFYNSFHDVLTGKESGLYSFNTGSGLNYYAFISYYLGGFLTPIIFFFSKAALPTAYYCLTLLKIGLAGFTFWIYAKETFKLKPIMNVGLSTAYSLMSFIIAHSEVIIWLDIFIYFPLIILGIDRLLEKRKLKCLFFSYLALFLTNYYFAFMIGVFSFLYFIVRYVVDFQKFKDRFIPYIATSLLSGMSAMVMILPTVLDLSQNGQPLTKIEHLFVKEAGFWDIVVKNFIGVYDTTKYDTIPFIYIGLIPLIFAIFFFVSKKIRLKEKIGYGLLGGFIFLSFIIWPLALFWQGFHAPIMFHFRFSFVMSFFIIMLAGKSMTILSNDSEELDKISWICYVLIFIFAASMTIKRDSQYLWVSAQNVSYTIAFVVLYMTYFKIQGGQLKVGKWTNSIVKHGTIILVLAMFGEAFINAHFVINKMHHEWPYLMSRTYYKNNKNIEQLVDFTKENNQGDFYRTETLMTNGRPNNDPIRYGYPSLHMFSSVRNCNVSNVLNGLGFRNAQNDGLTVDYLNNTLIMDSIMGVRYNMAETNPVKYGYKKVDQSGDVKLYENKYALPMGILAKGNIAKFKMDYNKPLIGQKNLIKGLTGKPYNDLYTTIEPKLVEVENTEKPKPDSKVVKSPMNYANTPRYFVYEAEIPQGYQAYFQISPVKDVYKDFEFNTWATVTSPKYDNGHKQIRSLGEFYNLGYYEQNEKIKFVVKIDGRNNFKMKKPKIVLMNLNVYDEIMNQLKNQGIEFQIHKNTAIANVNASEKTDLFTTIPYDKGWSLTIDGKQQKIHTVNDGFIRIKIPEGKHKIKLTYFPPGLKIGFILFISCTLIFLLYNFFYERKYRDKKK